jgi:methylated-DNA-protein-cysteine methyltransferase related protein
MDAKLRLAIYRIVRRIPRGSVLSYGDIGKRVGTGPRQVAAAIRACPPGLPWHRVVGAGGKILTPGETAWTQRELLMREGIHFRGSGFNYRLYKAKA